MTEQKKIKYALVIPAEDRFKPLAEWRGTLCDRAICDDVENPDTSVLQVLPYIAVVDEFGCVFAYTRGNGGDESRLHSKKSVGLGGHIDSPVTTTIEDLIVAEAIREIEEESGYAPPEELIRKALESSVIIYEPLTPVDSVHIAVAMIIQVKRSDLTKLEDGIIINPEWLDSNTLAMQNTIQKFVKPESMKWVFETWSSRLLEINATVESYSAYNNARQAEMKAFVHATKTVELINSNTRYSVRVKTSDGIGIQTSKSHATGWTDVSIPVYADWNSITYEESSNKYTLTADNGASLVTKDLALWEVISPGREEQVTESAFVS